MGQNPTEQHNRFPPGERSHPSSSSSSGANPRQRFFDIVRVNVQPAGGDVRNFQREARDDGHIAFNDVAMKGEEISRIFIIGVGSASCLDHLNTANPAERRHHVGTSVEPPMKTLARP